MWQWVAMTVAKKTVWLPLANVGVKYNIEAPFHWIQKILNMLLSYIKCLLVFNSWLHSVSHLVSHTKTLHWSHNDFYIYNFFLYRCCFCDLQCGYGVWVMAYYQHGIYQLLSHIQTYTTCTWIHSRTLLLSTDPWHMNNCNCDQLGTKLPSEQDTSCHRMMCVPSVMHYTYF